MDNKKIMVKDKICKALRKAIILGQLDPGERLIESELSERYGVSRGMIREALTLLSNEGFTIITPNKGASVAKISIQDLEEYYKLLAVLEGKAAMWATPNILEEDIAELIDINDSTREAMASDSKTKLTDWSKLNLTFHRFLWDRCGNDKLGWLVELIRQRIYRYRYTLFIISSYDKFLKDHSQIIDYIRQQKPDKAGQAMEAHVYRSLDVLKTFFAHI